MTDECKGFPDKGRVTKIFFFTNRLASKNFQKHLENGDMKKIEAQIKRGSVKCIDNNKQNSK